MIPFAQTQRCARCCTALGVLQSVCPVCGCRERLPSERLMGRYRVGTACADGDGTLVWAYDERDKHRVLLEISSEGHRERFFRRAETLMRVADSPLLVPVRDAFDTADGAVCVHGEPNGLPLQLAAFLPENDTVTQRLSLAADALLVLHSLRIGHGALSANRFYLAADGALSLFVPAAAGDTGEDPDADIAADLCRLGEIASALHGRISRRQDSILSALAAGRYATALELRHALSGLTEAEAETEK